MSAPQISAFVLGMGLCTLPAAALAQSNEKREATPAASTTASTGDAGQVSAQSWTDATVQTPSGAQTAPNAVPTTSPPPSTPVQLSPQPANNPSAEPSSITATPESPSTPPSDEPVTVFGTRNAKIGGYGALSTRYARLHGDDGALVGIEGAMLIDHRLAIGLAGYGWTNDRHMSAPEYVGQRYMKFGYGGLLVRYHVFIPQSPVSISVATLIGAGAVGFTADRNDDLQRDDSDSFFVFEPQLGVHVNLTRWMRAGVDAGYRIVSGVDRFGFTEANFRGASVGGSLGFGWF